MDWPGLLKWSLSYSDGTAPSGHSKSSGMSSDDMKFLEAAIRDYLSTVEDPNKIVQETAAKIQLLCTNTQLNEQQLFDKQQNNKQQDIERTTNTEISVSAAVSILGLVMLLL
eukprot:GHVS01024298.1.p1 GENE.GHVS01024298.1~~GHVS01024298.1.p1  ORF type:complete len:112 (+),score=29.39 GHVS01024298.1:125-460(+)